MPSFSATAAVSKLSMTPTHALFSFYIVLITSLINAHCVSCFEYEVGGTRGWVKPAGNESEAYNEWAQHNRFQIGDNIVFKYSKNDDSVLEVTKQDYDDCNTKNPISRYEDGDTAYKFDRSGFFYFVSGEENHCGTGQKMIVRVMVQSNNNNSLHSPVGSPVPSGGGGAVPAGDGSSGSDGGASVPAANDAGTRMASVASFMMCVLAGVLVFLFTN